MIYALRLTMLLFANISVESVSPTMRLLHLRNPTSVGLGLLNSDVEHGHGAGPAEVRGVFIARLFVLGVLGVLGVVGVMSRALSSSAAAFCCSWIDCVIPLFFSWWCDGGFE